MNRKRLHEVEMDLAWHFDNGTLTREHIINHFTNLMGEVSND